MNFSNRYPSESQKCVPFIPVWGSIFLAISVGLSVVLHIVLFLTANVSVASDVVFGGEALVSGVLSDVIMRRRLGRKLVPWEKWPVSILWVWVPLCLYVMFYQPFR